MQQWTERRRAEEAKPHLAIGKVEKSRDGETYYLKVFIKSGDGFAEKCSARAKFAEIDDYTIWYKKLSEESDKRLRIRCCPLQGYAD